MGKGPARRPTNPLGARAIYLTSGGKDYGYRIHGTPEWKSIGRNASSGCIRMINQDVIDLYGRLQGGEKVIVLTAAGEMPKGLYIPKPPAPKKPRRSRSFPPGAVPALKVLPPPSIAVPGAAPVVPAVGTCGPGAPRPAATDHAGLRNGAGQRRLPAGHERLTGHRACQRGASGAPLSFAFRASGRSR
jgi:hypothetical protein